MFTPEDHKALPKRQAMKLTRDFATGKYFFEPRELTGAWPKVKKRVLAHMFSCLVIATDHEDFRSAYADLIMTNSSPPIADLCDAIRSWLRDADLRPRERVRLKAKLRERRKYMLICRH
jgi:hypothetical protein